MRIVFPYLKALLLIVFIFSVLPLLAQKTATIKGVIKDSDGNPIPQAYVLSDNLSYKTLSDEDGKYKLIIPADTNIRITFSHIAFQKQYEVFNLKADEVKEHKVFLKSLNLETFDVVGEESHSQNLQRINVKSVGIQPSISGGIEGMVKSTGIGVSSRDELSASYSVRGGSFDENLVYVNGIEIYRPQLIRAGQEEGLSFINPNLVESVNFSAGGYGVNYGDKMSSVLDVKYRRPSDLGASVTLSLLGADFHVEGVSKDDKVAAILGFRYKTTQYILGTLDQQGEYDPNFLDLQAYVSYKPGKKSELTYLGYVADNNYTFLPQSQTTELGNLGEVLRLNVALDGKEVSEYRSLFNALSYYYQLNKDVRLSLQASASLNKEEQSFDVEGLYILGEVDNDVSSQTFGDVVAYRGIGAFIEHSRDFLESEIYSIQHNGSYNYANKQLDWGLEFKNEQIADDLNEWVYQDSSGYSVPRTSSGEIVLNDIVYAQNRVNSNRFLAYVKNSWNLVTAKEGLIDLNIGLRAQYWTFNDQTMISPRGAVSYKPNIVRVKNDSTTIKYNLTFRFAAGVYYQPPFYHAMRDLSGLVPAVNGQINPNIRAQESLQFILGVDYVFFLFKRPFKWTTEMYYKPMWNLIPFQTDNLRLEYYATNNSIGYAYGMDMKLNGEFIKGIESYVGFGLLKTQEDISNDSYYSNDSIIFYPGYIPRPFDQRFSFNLMFQDEMPMWPSFKVHLNLSLVTGFPFGPPNGQRYQQTARSSPYRRVDIGFSKTFVDPQTGKTKGLFKPFSDAWISLEIFNLIDIPNTISYNWIEDIAGVQYAIPNYLTGRRFNVKLHLAF
jgi:hypothetical protein